MGHIKLHIDYAVSEHTFENIFDDKVESHSWILSFESAGYLPSIPVSL